MQPIRVIAFDDSKDLREMFRMLVDAQPDMVCVAVHADLSQVMRDIDAARPDVIVMDIQMPGMNGIERVKAIKARYPGEVGLAAASMLTGGTLARHPKLRIAFSHGGGTLRSILPRLQHAWSAFEPLRQLMPESPGELVRRMYYDDLVYDGESIGELLRVFGPTQVMAGTDYPFAIMDREPSARLAALAVDEPTRYPLRSGNAKRWLDMTRNSRTRSPS